MNKDFKKWSGNKADIHNHKERPFFHEREIWWCALGENIGFEQDGKGVKFARPIIVFKKFNKEVFWAIPLSTKMKKSRFYVSLSANDNIQRVAIVSQLRLVDSKRLLDKIAVVSKDEYQNIQKAVISLCSS